MVIKRINDDKPYRELLEQSLDEVVPHVAYKEGGYTRQEAFIFLSAPNSITPTHLDPEHNLLLQIRGTKEMTIGSYPSADAEHREVERYFGGGHRNLEELPADSTTYDMHPGDGVYVPIYAPHVVHNGPAVSISFSITFYTEASERDQSVYSVNARLRKLGLSPKDPGINPRADRIKAGTWDSLRKVKHVAGSVRGG
jgi:ribosomal protein L16 Arg81 hydroxylase